MQNPVRGGDRSCNGTNGSKIVPTDRPRANLPAADNHRIVRADAIQHCNRTEWSSGNPIQMCISALTLCHNNILNR